MAEASRIARAICLFCVVAAVVAIAWVRLFDQRPATNDLLEMVGIAAIPFLAALLVQGYAVVAAWPLAIAASLLLAAGSAFRVPMTELRPGPGHDFTGPISDGIRVGMRDTFDTEVPVDRLAHPEIESLALLAVFAFVAVAGMLLARGRYVPAAVVLLVAVGWPSTPIAAAGGNSLGIGALILAAVLLLLLAANASRGPVRGLGPAVILAAVAGLAAVGASTSSAVAKDGIVDWRGWSPYEEGREQVGVRYVWSTSYAPLRWPDEPTVVLRVRAPDRPLYWRATTLDEYTGIGWREALDTGADTTRRRFQTVRDPMIPAGARLDGADVTRQDVTVAGLSDNHLVAASTPVRWLLGQSATTRPARGGVVLIPDGLVRGQSYTVWSYTPEVSPKTLVDLPADYPRAARRYLEVAPDLRVPQFAAEGRDDAVREILASRPDDLLVSDLERLFDEARTVVEGAPSPYVVAVSLEQWFRTGGGFEYDESPPQPAGDTAPLVDFVLDHRSGYCQHYSGAMALMLRLLGIPSRVAVGFVSGEYDDATGEWVVADRDAHSWVEVWFPEYGWLPFDPTPGRGRIAEPYSAASPGFSLVEEEQGGGVDVARIFAQRERLAEIFSEQLQGLQGLVPQAPDEATPPPADAPESGSSPGAAASGDGPSLLPLWIALAVVGAIGLFLGGKELRRRLRYAGRGPREQAAACRRDLVGFLADQRLDLPASLTLTELGQRLRSVFAVEPDPFVQAASAARFGSPEAAAEQAGVARRELRELRRELRRELGLGSRVAGAFRLRSLRR